jgi:hypothetical protein
MWVDAEVMEARVRAAQADSALRRELDEPQPDTLAYGALHVTDARRDGLLTSVPDTSFDAILNRSGNRELTSEEWPGFLRENGSEMLPPDGEG